MEFSEVILIILAIALLNKSLLAFKNNILLTYAFALLNVIAIYFVSPFTSIALIFYCFTIYLLFVAPKSFSKFLCLGLILISLMLLALWKYSPEILSNTSEYIYIDGAIGLSFLTFQYIYILRESHALKNYSPKQYQKLFPASIKALSDPHRLIAGPLFNIGKRHQIIPKDRISKNSLVLNLWIILYGSVLKFSVADNLSAFIDNYYSNPEAFSGIISMLTLLLYNAQILCDFMGFSIISLGIVRLCGNRCTINFNNPYMAYSFKDFWARWHISLSTWFRDFIYIPLGGSRVSKLRTIINVLIVMLISGAWHGSTNNFILWGLMHAIFLVANNNIRFNVPRYVGRIFVFICVTLTWILFRSPNLDIAFRVVKSVHNPNDQIFQNIDVYAGYRLFIGLSVIILLLVIQTKYARSIKKLLLERSNKFNWKILMVLPITYLLLVSTGNFWGSNVIYAGF